MRPNGGWSISGSQRSVLSTPQTLDPSMRDWYQYRTWNLTHRCQLSESRHMIIIQRHYYQNAAAQWQMVHIGTQGVGPINTPNIGPIDWGLISISAMKSNPWSPVKRIKAHDISYGGTTTNKLRPDCGWSISGPHGSVLSTLQILDTPMKDWHQYRT